MKKILLFLLMATPGMAANLLVNPGFEEWTDDSTPSGWTVEASNRTAALRESDTVRTGLSSARLLRLDTAPGNNKGLAQRVGVRVGAWYRLSVQCRDDNPDVQLGALVSWRRTDSSYISSSGVEYSADSSGWQLVEDSVQAPTDAAFADFLVRTYAPSGMTGPRRVLLDEAFFGSAAATQDTYKLWFAQDSIGDRLVDYFGLAQASIDYCCYNSTRPDVVQALLDAHVRGVQVRVVTEDSRLDDPWVGQLRAAGIPVWTDSIGPNSSWLMHNKFAIRDARDADTTDDRVWAASYNPNDGELRADFALELPVPGLARAYAAEFGQMWGGSGTVPVPESSRFHNAKTDRLATHRFELEGHPVQVYFSPQDRPVDTIARLVGAAQRHVLFGVLTLTHDGVGDAMVDRWQNSVWVGGVIDRSGINNQGSEYQKLVTAGIPVYEDSVPFGEKMIHEKLGVIDSALVIAGSVNWSANGNENNDEHMLLIEHPAIARKFLAELSQRFREATHPGIDESQRVSREQRAARKPTVARSLERIARGAAVMDAGGRVIVERQSLVPGIYFIRESADSPPSGTAPVFARVVIVR